MTKSKIIPFWVWPFSWGMAGDTREIAKAEYELDGIELEEKLITVRNKYDKDKIKSELVELNYRNNLISTYEYDLQKSYIDNKDDEEAKELAKLEIQLRHNKITENEYDRKRADLLEEPWASMPKIHWDPVNNGKTFFELDYNDHFVPFLKENGYAGAEDDDVVNMWLNDVCISILEELTGMDADLATPYRREDLTDE